MKKIFFCVIGVLTIVGTALALDITKLGGVIYREGNTSGICDMLVQARAIVPAATPNSIPDFATNTPGMPCREVFTITQL